jgi:catechol 2,3-dioxygenase-like lactoylglutathione lyase family enzyme
MCRMPGTLDRRCAESQDPGLPAGGVRRDCSSSVTMTFALSGLAASVPVRGYRRYVACVEQRISLVTLGVADVTRARTFYERLGWQGQEVEETVFFQAGGMALVLWGRDKLADDAGIEDRTTDGFGGMTLAHNVRSRIEVDEVLGDAANAGAEITRAARETFYGGYAGCFTDPDGHVWEIAYNPGFSLGQDGSITIPDFGAS